MKRTELEDLFLELLANTPSSFAALYGFLARRAAATRPSIAEALDVASSFEEQDWIRSRRTTPDGRYAAVSDVDRARMEREYRSWLEAPMADLSVDALSNDEVGLWFEVRPGGLAEWQRRASHAGETPLFTIDLDVTSGQLTVHATDAGAAQKALAEWLNQNPSVELISGSAVVKELSSLQLRGGQSVRGGVELRANCTARSSVDPEGGSSGP